MRGEKGGSCRTVGRDPRRKFHDILTGAVPEVGRGCFPRRLLCGVCCTAISRLPTLLKARLISLLFSTYVNERIRVQYTECFISRYTSK